jgi:hypothetical protein
MPTQGFDSGGREFIPAKISTASGNKPGAPRIEPDMAVERAAQPAALGFHQGE